MNLVALKRQDVPLHAEVAESLRHQIMSGELRAGARLPALNELVERMGVARMTVVQAMNTLRDEGLIEKRQGLGTFVRDVAIPERHTLHMRADLGQLQDMAKGLEVLSTDAASEVEAAEDGREYRCMRRTHAREGRPFCRVDLRLDETLYQKDAKRFSHEIVVTVLEAMGVSVASARQNVTISYADLALAQALEIRVNSAVFRVRREFFDGAGALIYSATLLYPGDLLALEIDFTTPDAPR